MSSPWMKFYPSDWRADPALRMCSIGARGLWMEMLCLMHEAEPYGSLRVNGKPVADRQLAMLSGVGHDQVADLVAELEEAGVLSRDADGVVVSRRMQRDKAKAESDKSNGKRGGNPGLREGVNPQDKGEDKAQKPEARSHTPETKNTTRPPVSVAEGARDFFDLVWEAFPRNPTSNEGKAEAAFRATKASDQPVILTAAQRYSRWFTEDCQRRKRTVDAGLSFVPHLATWIETGAWKEAGALPIKAEKSAPVVPMTRIDRVLEPDVWAACERLQGKRAPTSDTAWSFPAEVVTKARGELRGQRTSAEVH